MSQNSTNASIITEINKDLAKARYIALQTDSALHAYYNITEELEIGLQAARIELNKYIKDLKHEKLVNKNLAVELVKKNNALAKARRNNFISFAAGAGIVFFIETTALLIGIYTVK